MAVSANYRAFILEQLGRVLPDVRARSMFGGVGVYSGLYFFALLDNDTLYFKVDEQTRPAFEAINMGPFRPFGEGGEAMQYYEVSAEIVEDLDALRDWATKAVAVAHRAKSRRAKAPAAKSPAAKKKRGT
jgi:DNA transformation protein